MDIQLDSSRPIIFAADLHIKPAWSSQLPKLNIDSEVGLREYLKVVDECNACAIILGGDIFDVNYLRHVWLQKLFFAWVDELSRRDCQVLAFPGNHDAVLYQRDFDDTEGIGEVVHIHSTHAKVIDIDGKSFSHGDRVYQCIGHCDHPAKLQAAYDQMNPKADTLLLHQLTTKFGGSTDLNDVPAHIRTILLGDVHMFADGTTANGAWWGYPGCMFPQSVVETDHGVFIVDPDKESIPTRQTILARKAKQFDIDTEEQVDRVLTYAADFVNQVAGEQLPAEIAKPVVQIRVIRHHVADVHTKLKSLNWTDNAHVVVMPQSAKMTIDFNPAEATSSVPTPIDLLPEFVKRLKGDSKMAAANCPYPEESEALVRELLLSGGAGRKAGDDEVRADGKPLAHASIIAAAIENV